MAQLQSRPRYNQQNGKQYLCACLTLLLENFHAVFKAFKLEPAHPCCYD